MNCSELHEHLADYLGDELAPPLRRAFEEHLRECASCRNESESLADTVAALRQLETVTPAQARQRVRKLRVVRTSSWGQRVALSLLKTAAVLLLGAGLGRYTAPASPEASSAPARAPDTSRQSATAEPTVHPGWIELGRKAHISRSRLLGELLILNQPS